MSNFFSCAFYRNLSLKHGHEIAGELSAVDGDNAAHRQKERTWDIQSESVERASPLLLTEIENPLPTF